MNHNNKQNSLAIWVCDPHQVFVFLLSENQINGPIAGKAQTLEELINSLAVVNNESFSDVHELVQVFQRTKNENLKKDIVKVFFSFFPFLLVVYFSFIRSSFFLSF